MVGIAQAKRAAKMPRKQARAYMSKVDWTIDPKTGRTNSSPTYLALVKDVESMIRGSASTLIAGGAYNVAGFIVAQLAHVHGMKPGRKSTQERGTS